MVGYEVFRQSEFSTIILQRDWKSRTSYLLIEMNYLLFLQIIFVHDDNDIAIDCNNNNKNWWIKNEIFRLKEFNKKYTNFQVNSRIYKPSLSSFQNLHFDLNQKVEKFYIIKNKNSIKNLKKKMKLTNIICLTILGFSAVIRGEYKNLKRVVNKSFSLISRKFSSQCCSNYYKCEW